MQEMPLENRKHFCFPPFPILEISLLRLVSCSNPGCSNAHGSKVMVETRPRGPTSKGQLPKRISSSGRITGGALRDVRLRRLRAASAPSSRRSGATTCTPWGEIATRLESTTWRTLAHATAATGPLEPASWTETLLGVALDDGEALATDGEWAGSYGGLECFWAPEIDEGAVLIIQSVSV